MAWVSSKVQGDQTVNQEASFEATRLMFLLVNKVISVTVGFTATNTLFATSGA